MPQTRICSECKKKLPLTTEHFYRNGKRGSGNGFRLACKACMYVRRSRLFSEDPTPERFLRFRWNALCKARRKKDTYIAADLDGFQGITYLMKLWHKQRGRCALTGIPMTWQGTRREDIARGYGLGRNVSVDRIASARGDAKGNLRLICSQLNYMRGSLEDSDFLLWCELVVRHNGPPPPGFIKEREHAQAMAGNDEEAGGVSRRAGGGSPRLR